LGHHIALLADRRIGSATPRHHLVLLLMTMLMLVLMLMLGQ
jgi:hypothetical protein